MLFAIKKYLDEGMSIKITQTIILKISKQTKQTNSARNGAILEHVLEKFNKKYRIVILYGAKVSNDSEMNRNYERNLRNEFDFNIHFFKFSDIFRNLLYSAKAIFFHATNSY
jgi:hypothetical protein